MKRGFTLIELLVAISIIAILSILGLSAYQAVQKSARDAKRQSDLKFIQSALEDYHADQLSYPPSLNDLTSGSRIYLKQVPTDPKGVVYSYVPSPPSCSDSSCIGYCLYAGMEAGTFTSDSGCNSYPSTNYNYGVTRP